MARRCGSSMLLKQFLIPRFMYTELHKYAVSNAVSVSSVIRVAIYFYLDAARLLDSQQCASVTIQIEESK